MNTKFPVVRDGLPLLNAQAWLAGEESLIYSVLDKEGGALDTSKKVQNKLTSYKCNCGSDSGYPCVGVGGVFRCKSMELLLWCSSGVGLPVVSGLR